MKKFTTVNVFLIFLFLAQISGQTAVTIEKVNTLESPEEEGTSAFYELFHFGAGHIVAGGSHLYGFSIYSIENITHPLCWEHNWQLPYPMSS